MKRRQQAAVKVGAPTDSAQSGRETRHELSISQQSLRALLLLRDAQNYAPDLGRSIWDFAEEIQELQPAGITNSDLRWLVCKGFVEHGTEVNQPAEQPRTFQPSAGLVFNQKTCFVLTEAGAKFYRDFTAPRRSTMELPSLRKRKALAT